jgi:hypothetical protein
LRRFLRDSFSRSGRGIALYRFCARLGFHLRSAPDVKASLKQRETVYLMTQTLGRPHREDLAREWIAQSAPRRALVAFQ